MHTPPCQQHLWEETKPWEYDIYIVPKQEEVIEAGRDFNDS